MNNIITAFSLGLGLVVYPAQMMMAQELPLRQINPTEINIVWSEDEQLWGTTENPGDKWSLIRAISYSLRYLDTPKAAEVYNNYPIPGVTRDRVRRSLSRFKELLKIAKTPEALQAAIEKEFTLYQSVGHDNQGTVHFTGYFEPVYTASRQRTSEYRYPLYL
ncbi:MltA domain-containing protein, partial [Crocosphaera chwakensis]